jgi:sterol 3beta-glucosyltransferase
MTKRICILTMGTLGDVRPYCALGLALRRSGYLVRMAVPENFITYSTDLGLETVRCGEDFHELMKAEVAKRFFAAGYFRRQLLAPQFAKHLFRSVCQDAFEATTDASAIIFHPKIEIGLDLARPKGVPAFLASVVPIIPTSKFPIYTSSKRSWGSLLNYLSYRGYAINRVRFSSEFREFATQKLKVAAPPRWAYPYDTRSKDFITLCGISPTLLDRPNDWSYTVHMTGFWTSSSPEREPDAALDAFLDAGPAPLYIGFGSMIGDPRKQRNARTALLFGSSSLLSSAPPEPRH